MPLVEHLAELRKVALRCLFIVGAAFFLSYSYGDHIAEFLLIPLRDALKNQGQGQIVFLEVLDKVLAQFQVAFWSAIIISSPLWFREVWSFIKPGLYEKEIKVIRPFMFVGFLLFLLGILFGYYIVFPLTFETLMSFGVENATATLSLKGYLVLACKVLVFLGLVFQLPNLMLILGFMGLVTKQSLKTVRPYVYVGFSVLSAVVTPPDPLTLMMLWFPLVLLYESGILGVALFVHPWLARKVQKEMDEEKQTEKKNDKQDEDHKEAPC